jgi:DNA polymerase-3 subunit alpha
MAAVLNHAGSIEKITFFMEECKRMGILVLGPDINESQRGFAVNNKGEIRFGMMGLKGVGENAIECILEERKKRGPFTNIFDLVKRVSLRAVTKKSLESLAYSGAFDCFKEYHRAQYFLNKDTNICGLDIIVNFGNRFQAQAQSSVNSLFGDLITMDIPTPQIPKTDPWPLTELLDYEKEVTGMFMSGHPLDHFKFELKHYGFMPLNEFNEVKEAPQLLPNTGKTFRLAGLVTEAQHKVKKTGRNFGSFCIEDFTGKTELMLWSDDYVKYKNYLEKGRNIFVSGCFKQRYNSTEFEFKIQSITMLEVTKQNFTRQLVMDVPVKAVSRDFVDFIDKNIKTHPGKSSLKFNIYEPKENLKLSLYSLEKGFTMNDEMVNFIEENQDIEVQVVTTT